jgi:undecaprenyl-phosphate galactose phosphotransferase
MDLIVFSVSVIIAEKIYSNPHWRGFPDSVQPWVYIVPSFIQLVISIFGSVYKKNSISILRVFISLFYGLILLSSLTFFFKQVAFSRAVVLITYLLSMILLSGWRIAVKIFFNKSLNSDIKKSRTLIIGDDLKTEELASKLRTYSSKVYKIIGLVSFRKDRIGEKAGAFKILGSTENIKKLIKDEKIDKVIFSNENLALNQMFAIVSECQGTNVEFLVAGKELDYLVGKSSITMLDDIPLLKVQYNISSLIHRFAKRCFDLVLSSLILILIYPFIYLIEKFISRKSDIIHFIFGVPGVFIGRNSFVGPRTVSFHDDLYVGKTALTGYWYVENLSQTDTDEIKKLDIFYAKNSNIWLDLEILGLTFAKMFFKVE